MKSKSRYSFANSNHSSNHPVCIHRGDMLRIAEYREVHPLNQSLHYQYGASFQCLPTCSKADSHLHISDIPAYICDRREQRTRFFRIHHIRTTQSSCCHRSHASWSSSPRRPGTVACDSVTFDSYHPYCHSCSFWNAHQTDACLKSAGHVIEEIQRSCCIGHRGGSRAWLGSVGKVHVLR